MSAPIGWGVIGTGPVAEGFARALAKVPGATRVAVASARPERAAAFARAHGFAGARDNVAALVADPAVEIVYVSSPTRLHLEHGLAAIAAGKAVLCEKPFTGDADEAQRLIDAAGAQGLFCMEAMWLRFNSVIRELASAIEQGAIGQPKAMTMSIGYAQPHDTLDATRQRLGVMPVFGCYGLSLAWHLFGAPRQWHAAIQRNAGGTDTDAAILLDHAGATAQITASASITLSNRIEVTGTEGIATIARDAVNPGLLDIRRHGAGGVKQLLADGVVPLRLRLPTARRARNSGFTGEIIEAMRCVRAGLLESPVMPHADTVAIQRLAKELGGPAN